MSALFAVKRWRAEMVGFFGVTANLVNVQLPFRRWWAWCRHNSLQTSQLRPRSSARPAFSGPGGVLCGSGWR